MKEHFNKYKLVYISAGVSITIAGITCTLMRGRYAELLSGSDTAENSVFVRPLSILSNQRNNIVTVIERAGQGHPGYLVRCLETGTIFSSQKQAAIMHGVSDAILSLHVRGKIPNINGLHFERVSLV
jgi:hypothetical protein